MPTPPEKFPPRRKKILIAAFTLTLSALLAVTGCNSKEDSSESSSEAVTSYSPKVETTPATTTTTPETLPPLLEGVEAELEKNEDTAGHIEIPGIVDEPVVQCEDNDFYVNHGYNKQPLKSGAIFADFRNVLMTSKQSDNVILYGHSQADSSRFGPLQRAFRWNTSTTYKNHPLIYFRTNYEERVYKIYSIFLINTEEQHDDAPLFDYHNFVSFRDNTDYSYQTFIDNLDKRNMISTDVDAQPGDRFLTLSTCAYDFPESRLVIVGRLLREGESEEVDMTKFSMVQNPYMPKVMRGNYTPA